MVRIVEKELDKYSEEFFEHAEEMLKIPLIKGLRITIDFENGESLICTRIKNDVSMEKTE